MGDKERFQVCSPQMQSHTFYCTPIEGSETPSSYDWQQSSASGGVNEVPWDVVGLTPHFQEAHQCAKCTVQGGSQPHPMVAHLKWGGDRDTHLMLYRPLFAPSWTVVALCIAQH